MKERKKPEKFWLPHGMPSDDREFAFSSRVFPKASQIQALYKLWHYQTFDAALSRDVGIPAPLTLPVLQPVDIRIVNVEIRDTAHNRLVTCIAILSPVNKREPGLTIYRQKRHRLYQAGVHLIELDFIRRGTRPCAHPRIPDVPYVITVIRAHTSFMDIWPLGLRDPLPIVPVPLHPLDAEVCLDLPLALTSIYDEAAYDLSIDYSQSPPPPMFAAADTQWMHALLGKV